MNNQTTTTKEAFVRDDGAEFDLTIAQPAEVKVVDRMQPKDEDREVVKVGLDAAMSKVVDHADLPMLLLRVAGEGGFWQGICEEDGGLWCRRVFSIEEAVADWSA